MYTEKIVAFLGYSLYAGFGAVVASATTLVTMGVPFVAPICVLGAVLGMGALHLGVRIEVEKDRLEKIALKKSIQNSTGGTSGKLKNNNEIDQPAKINFVKPFDQTITLNLKDDTNEEPSHLPIFSKNVLTKEQFDAKAKSTPKEQNPAISPHTARNKKSSSRSSDDYANMGASAMASSITSVAVNGARNFY